MENNAKNRNENRKGALVTRLGEFVKSPLKLAIAIGTAVVIIGAVIVGTSLSGSVDASTPPNDVAYFLSATDDGSYTLDETVSVPSLLYVNGEKTLSGSGCLNAEAGIGEYMIVINDGASLTLDGVTLNGNGMAVNGIYVSPLGTLIVRDGAMMSFPGHGVRVLGDARFDGGSISGVGTNWLMVDDQATVTLAAGSFTDCGEAGLLTGAGAAVELGEGVSLSGSGSYLVYNTGDMTVTGGSYTDSGNYSFHNEGKLRITDTDFTGALALGYVENASGATMSISGGSMKDSKADFIFNQGSLTVEKLVMDGSKSTAIETRGSSSELTLLDCSMDNIGKNAILSKAGLLTAENLAIGECGACGIHSRGAVFNGRNVTIASAGDVGIYNNSVSDSDATVGTLTLDGFEIGTAASYCIRTNGGEMTLSNGTVGKGESYGLYVKDGRVTTDHVDFLGTNDSSRCVVQVGLSKHPAGELIMNETTVTGGAKGITNHGNLVFNSGRIYGNTNSSTGTGAGVYNSATFTMTGGVITGNRTQGSGGGVSNSNGTFFMKGGTIYGNASGKYGGGIYNSGKLDVTGGTISGNRCISGGGGIECTGVALIKGATIHGNVSDSGGGGIYVGTRGALTVYDSVISGNSSSNGKSGGGISINGGKCTIGEETIIKENTSASNGGGVYNYGELTLRGATVTGNTAVKNGGGLANSSYTNDDGVTYTGVFQMDSGEISANTAAQNGGGIYSAARLLVRGGAISKNRAVLGGGIYTNNLATLEGGAITANSSTGHGGGLYMGSSEKSVTTISGGGINGNTCGAGCCGAGLYNDGTTTLRSGPVFSGNGAADTLGGGIYNHGKLTLYPEVPVISNLGAAGPNICNDGLLILQSGKQQRDIYLRTSAFITLDGALVDGSLLSVSMESFFPGYYVAKSADSSVTAAVDANMFSLVNNSSLPDTEKLAINRDNGCLEDAVTGPQAKLELSDGGFEEGDLADLAALAGTEGYTGNITLLRNCVISTALAPTAPVAIDGNGSYILFTDEAGGLTLNGSDNALTNLTLRTSVTLTASAVTVPSGVTATISGCCFDTCRSAHNGGAIYSAGNVTITDTAFTSCVSESSGGAIYINKDSSASLANLTATGGSAGNYGRDIYIGTASKPASTPVTVSGTMTVGELYLATDRYITATGTPDAASSIGIRIAAKRFIPGTQLVSGCSQSFVPTVVLLNDPSGSTGVYLSKDGFLLTSKDASLYKNGSFVKYGNLADLLRQVGTAGDEIRLFSDSYLTESVTVSAPVVLKGEGKSLFLSSKGAGITFCTTGSSSVSGMNVTLKEGFSGYEGSAFSANGGATISFSDVSFSGLTAAGHGSAVRAAGSVKLNVTDCSFEACAGTDGYALSALENSTLNMSKSAFSGLSAFEVSKSFHVSETNICDAMNLTAYPASSSSASLAVEKYEAGTKLYSWTMTDGKTAGQLAALFANITISNVDSSAELSLELFADSRVALLIAGTEAVLYDSASAELARGRLTDMLAHESLSAGCTVKLIASSVLDSAVEVDKSITIDGDGHSINAVCEDARLLVSVKNVSLQNLTLTSNTTLSGSALLVKNSASVTAAACSFSCVSSTVNGAAVSVEKGGQFTATDCTFSGNTTAAYGSALCNEGTASISGGSFSGNTANGKYGGAIYNLATLTLEGTTLSGNSAASYGGAFYSSGDGVVTMKDLTFSGNSSGSTGRDIYNRAIMFVSGKLLVEDLYLYDGHHLTLTAPLDSASAIRAEIQKARFMAGTVVMDCVSGITETQLADALQHITLANNANLDPSAITVTLGRDGVLDEAGTVELLDDEGNSVATGSLAEMLNQAQAGYTVRLLKGAGLTEPITLGCSITLDTNGNTLRLSNSAAGITIPAACTLNAGGVTISSGFGAGITNHGTLNIGGSTLTGCPIVSDGTLRTDSALTASASPISLSGSAELTLSTDSDVTLLGALSSSTSVRINTRNYTSGAVVVRSDISGAVTDNIDRFVLLNNLKSDGATPKSNPRLILDVTGALVPNPSFVPEAKLYASAASNAAVLEEQCALVDAIDEAVDGNCIVLLGNVSEQDIELNKSLTLDLGGYTLTGSGAAPVVSVGGTVTITNGAIAMPTSAYSPVNGGGIRNTGVLTLSAVTLRNCLTAENGGGIYNEGSVTMSSGSSLIGCIAKKSGGGIYNKGTVSMDSGVSITACTAGYGSSGNGAGIYSSGTLTIRSGASISANSTDSGNGGGVYQVGGTSDISCECSTNTDKNGTRDIYIASGSAATISGGSYNTVYTYTSGAATSLSITGGDFNTISRGKAAGAENYTTIAISGGRFVSEPKSYYLAPHSMVTTISEAPYRYSVVPTPVLANVVCGDTSTPCYSADEIKSAVLAAGTDSVSVDFVSSFSSGRIEFRTSSSDYTARSITLNLNGFTWTNSGTSSGLFMINKNTSVTVNGGSFVGGATYFYSNSGGVVTVNSGSFTGASSQIIGGSGTLIVRGGSFNYDPTGYVDTENYTVTLSEGVYTVAEKLTPPGLEPVLTPSIPAPMDEAPLTLTDALPAQAPAIPGLKKMQSFDEYNAATEGNG